MSVEESLSFPFKDQEWITKLGLGAVISLVPIFNLAWSGYLVELLRNVMNGETTPLPAWDDLDKKFRDGLVLFAAGLIYILPLLVFLLLPLSITVLSSVFPENRDMQALGRTLIEAGGILLLGLLCVLVLYGIAFSILSPAVLILFAHERTFASCFKLGQAFRLIRANARPFFLAWGLSLLIGLGVSLLVGFVNLVVGWIPCLGWIISLGLSLASGVYITTVSAYLFGLFGRTIFQQDRQPATP